MSDIKIRKARKGTRIQVVSFEAMDFSVKGLVDDLRMLGNCDALYGARHGDWIHIRVAIGQQREQAERWLKDAHGHGGGLLGLS